MDVYAAIATRSYRQSQRGTIGMDAYAASAVHAVIRSMIGTDAAARSAVRLATNGKKCRETIPIPHSENALVAERSATKSRFQPVATDDLLAVFASPGLFERLGTLLIAHVFHLIQQILISG